MRGSGCRSCGPHLAANAQPPGGESMRSEPRAGTGWSRGARAPAGRGGGEPGLSSGLPAALSTRRPGLPSRRPGARGPCRGLGPCGTSGPWGGTHLPWACWGPGGWQTPRPRTQAAAAPGRPSDLGEAEGGHRLLGPPPEPEAGRTRRAAGGGGGQGEGSACLGCGETVWVSRGPWGDTEGGAGHVASPQPRPRASETHQP